MFKASIIGDKAVIAKFEGLPTHVDIALHVATKRLAIMLEGYIKTSKLQGQVLKHQTGALSRSIQHDIKEFDHRTQGRVFSAGDVKYARIHEFGGVIHHPGGTLYYIDKATGMARFLPNLSEAAAWAYPRTRPHDIPMPERSFMRSSLRDKTEAIVKTYKDVAMKAMKQGATNG